MDFIELDLPQAIKEKFVLLMIYDGEKRYGDYKKLHEEVWELVNKLLLPNKYNYKIYNMNSQKLICWLNKL